MGSFYMNEAMFDLPDAGFVDRTVTDLAGTSPSGKGALLLIERRTFPTAASLRQVVAAFGSDAMTRFIGYRVLFEREIEVASQPAFDVGARWRAETGGPVYVRRVHLALGETWLIITGEVPIDDREYCDAYINHVLASLRLRVERRWKGGHLPSHRQTQEERHGRRQDPAEDRSPPGGDVVSAQKAARARKSPKAGGGKKKGGPKGSKGAAPSREVIEAAQQTERETGVPTSATLGQWALESGFGKHTPGNNPFGIKAREGEPYQLLWTKEKAKNGSGLVRVQQKFRKYDSLDEAFRARGKLLSKHYPIAMANKDNPDAFVAGLQANPKHQYATDPEYTEKVTGTMRANDYYKYDLKNGGGLTKRDNDASLRVIDGEPSVMLGSDQHMAAHVESPHTGGGKIVEGSSSVFVGNKQLAFARYGDSTNDKYQVVQDVQDSVLVG